MRDLELANVQEVKEYVRLSAGGYICKITSITDVPLNSKTGKGDYLKMEYDIAQGEFKDHYLKLYESKQFWGGNFIKSYKESALPFFKGFITAVEESNKFTFDNDEKKLVGKFIGLVLGEEEYQANDGSVKNRIYVKECRSVESIKKGDFKVPELKLSAGNAAKKNDGFMSIPDGMVEDLPFN